MQLSRRVGVVHFHAVIRLDGPDGLDTLPPGRATAGLLSDAITAVATSVQVRADLADATAGRPDADDVIMVGSELAANAVMHSRSGQFGGTFTVRAEIHDTYAWVEVEDQGGDWTGNDHQDDNSDEHGRGLAIIDAIAGNDNWGAERGDAPQSRVVWARIERQP